MKQPVTAKTRQRHRRGIPTGERSASSRRAAPRAATREEGVERLPGDSYMRGLREDHARFSRVLSLIGRQARLLEDRPEKVLPLFEEAVDYVVNFQNIYHHPREEIMFAKVGEKASRLATVAERLSNEHRAMALSGKRMLNLLKKVRTAPANRAARIKLARELEAFATEMRKHIGEEEKLLYSRAGAELEQEDWARVAHTAPPLDPLARAEGGRYPLLSRYVAFGDAHSEVSMEGGRAEKVFDSGMEILVSGRKAVGTLRSIARRHRKEAWALMRRSWEKLPSNPLLRPCAVARTQLEAAKQLRRASRRWFKDWQDGVVDAVSALRRES